MTLRDYLTVLRHLLQVKGIFPQLPLFSYFGPYIDGKAVNPILKEDSVTALFMPMLPVSALASLATMLGIPAGAAQHSTGMMLETADLPGRRKKGSGSWGGWACTSFFVDPETGIAAVWGTQLIHPSGWDAPYQKFEVELEQALYAGLEI
ncbi:hypothetical protein C8J57DRAFT_60934 [Mycena rebaudengoi]|nr:hypothetical protein C8J57DRAFT_60934 [Mycena rebaudengoi]